MKKFGYIVKSALLFTVALLCFASLSWSKEGYKQDEFVNLLNIEVGYTVSPGGYFFSDLGDWHGYGFNSSSDLSSAGAFRGPAFMGERNLGLQWLSDGFERLSLKDVDGNELAFTGICSYDYLPGMLKQSIVAGDLNISMREIALTDRSTMIEYTITNEGDDVCSFIPALAGTASYNDAVVSRVASNILSVSVVGCKHTFILSFPEGWILTSCENKRYEASTDMKTLAPGRSYTFQTFTSYCPGADKETALAVHSGLDFNGARKYFKLNAKRWNGYLASVLDRDTPYLDSERNRGWAVKAMMTLTTNWRSAAGDLKHAGVQPAAGHFNAFWAWDSWEHAVGLSLFNPELAKDQMLTMFDYQTPEGMIVDLIAFDKEANNNVCSKPPIAGWGTYMVYQRTKDIEFVKEMLPKLLRFHEWRYKYRDHDGNGLCEYGGTEPQVYQGQWESGMDVAVKFDGVRMLKNAEGAYSFDQESIELNCYLCAEKYYLAYLLDLAGRKDEAVSFRTEGAKLKKMIQDNFFDEETGFFYDRKVGNGELVKVIDISGWIPLFTNVATPEQAEAVKKNMLDKELFGTYFPFSSLNRKHPLYQPDKGYFRGQTWMNYTYFGIRGWKNYGFFEDADKYTRLLPDKLKGLAEPGMPIRENWNSATGEGMTAMHFGWSSAFSLLLMAEDVDKFPYVP